MVTFVTFVKVFKRDMAKSSMDEVTTQGEKRQPLSINSACSSVVVLVRLSVFLFTLQGRPERNVVPLEGNDGP